MAAKVGCLKFQPLSLKSGIIFIIGVPAPEQYWSKCKMADERVTDIVSVPATVSDYEVK